MKKLNLFALLTIILTFSINLFSQEEKPKEFSQVENTHQFGFTLKRANYSYTPSEYFESKDSTFGNLRKSGKLKNNDQVTYPVSFLYFNKNLNLYTEASYYKVSYANMYNLVVGQYIPSLNLGINDLYFYDRVQNSITRRESKVNFYTKTELNSSNLIYYGLGIRNLYKENFRQGNLFYSDDFLDSTNSYGLQVFLKYQVELASFVKLSISAEPFYTVGSRVRSKNHYINQNGSYNFSLYAIGQKNYYYGADLDFNFSFSLNENLHLLIGYNYIYTKIRHEKNRNYRLFVENGQPNFTSLLSQEVWNQPSNESKDHIFGYYIGLNAKF